MDWQLRRLEKAYLRDTTDAEALIRYWAAMNRADLPLTVELTHLLPHHSKYPELEWLILTNRESVTIQGQPLSWSHFIPNNSI